MAGKSIEERIDDLEKRKKQIEAQQQQLLARKKEKERKERTHRLVQIGAIMDSMGINTVEYADKLKNHYLENEKFKRYIDDFINKSSEK